MLNKLKSQFEELKSKVVFLDWVKKYLEVKLQFSRLAASSPFNPLPV